MILMKMILFVVLIMTDLYNSSEHYEKNKIIKEKIML